LGLILCKEFLLQPGTKTRPFNFDISQQ